jgi:hypothetical protein
MLVIDFRFESEVTMPIELRTRAEWSFACLKGALISYLHPGSVRKVTLQQFDTLKRRVQTSYGVSEEKIKEAIASCIDALPRCDFDRAEEVRQKYLH